jgi:integrase
MPNASLPESGARVLRVSDYLRHRTKTRDRGYCWVYLEDGTRKQRHLPGAFGSPESRRAFHELASAVLAGVVDPRRPLRGQRLAELPILVSEVVARFHVWAAGYYVKHGRPTREAQNFKDSTRELLDLFRDLPAAEFSVAKLELVRDAMVARGGLCRKTINARVRKIRSIFAWGVRKEIVPPTVYHSLLALKAMQPGRTAAPERDHVEAVDRARVDAILPHLTPSLRAMVEFAWWTGARPGEVCSLRWADVDRADPDAWLFCPADHKTSHLEKERVIGIGRSAQRFLEPFLRTPADEALFSPRRSEAERRLLRRQARKSKVTPSQERRDRERQRNPRRTLADRFDVPTFRRAIWRACDDAGVERFSPNQLRHAFQNRAEDQLGLERSSKAMGHTTLGTTEHYRSKRLAEAARDAAKLIG